MTFYAYIHAKPDASVLSDVFYVGKGVGSRYKVLTARNRYHGFVVNKHGASNVLVGKLDCSNEETAFELERGLIKCLRRSGVNLCNMTEGGEGSSGYRMPPEVRAKVSAAAKLVAVRPGVSERRSAATKAHNAFKWADPVYAERTAKAMRGVAKTPSEAATAARRANGAKSATPEAAAKKSAAFKALWSDPAFRARMLKSRAEKAAARKLTIQDRKDS